MRVPRQNVYIILHGGARDAQTRSLAVQLREVLAHKREKREGHHATTGGAVLLMAGDVAAHGASVVVAAPLVEALGVRRVLAQLASPELRLWRVQRLEAHAAGSILVIKATSSSAHAAWLHSVSAGAVNGLALAQKSMQLLIWLGS